jgi:phosphoribosyl-ATP pyrophosphohydrolase
MNGAEVLYALAATLEARKQADPRTSYVAGLYSKGLDAILKKIGEESTEVVMAAKDGEGRHLVQEVADLWFHCMVLLAHQGVGVDPVLAELQHRFGTSGLREKLVEPK